MKIDIRQLVVRPMTQADKKAVLEIDRAVSGKERSGYLEAKFVRATEDKEQLLNSLVVEHEGRVAGFVMGEIYLGEFGVPNDTAAIDTIGVHPDYQRGGVALCCFTSTRAMPGRRVSSVSIPWWIGTTGDSSTSSIPSDLRRQELYAWKRQSDCSLQLQRNGGQSLF